MLRQLLDADEIEVSRDNEEYWKIVSRVESSKWWRAYYRVATLLHRFIIYPCKELVCKVKGHDWENCSVVGPESGNISMYCKRCNESFTHWLY